MGIKLIKYGAATARLGMVSLYNLIMVIVWSTFDDAFSYLVSNESLDHQASDSAEQRWHQLVRSSENRSFGSQRRPHSLLEFHNVCRIRYKSVLPLSLFCTFLDVHSHTSSHKLNLSNLAVVEYVADTFFVLYYIPYSSTIAF